MASRTPKHIPRCVARRKRILCSIKYNESIVKDLRHTDVGFSTERLLTFETPLFRYTDFDGRVAFINAELDKVRAIPGVVGVGSIDMLPFSPGAGRHVRAGAAFVCGPGPDPDAGGTRDRPDPRRSRRAR
jgi:hypothetical protein